MKKALFLIFCIASVCGKTNATVHIVQVSNFQFTPANVSDVAVGDTMRWVWVSGNHTTTDDPATQSGNSLPAGAASWNAPMDATDTVFDYPVTVAGIYKYWCIPHQPFMAASFTASTALPVTLSSFAVSGSKGKAVISWKTMTEANTDYFSVRRSSNGSSYTEIAKIPAAGNSNAEKSYTFTDPVTNSNQYFYYNIAIVDKDGRQEFSATKVFKADGAVNKLILSISPNPVSGQEHLMMTFNAGKEGKMQVNVINPQGQMILKTQLQAYQGVNMGHVHLGNLPPGNYTLVCFLDGLKETYQVIIK